MNIRMFILASILILPVFLFNISCEKEQPISEDVALEQPMPESVGEEPQPLGVVHDEDEDEDADEDVDDELDEEEDADDDDYEDADEDADDELDEEEGEPEE
jgi:hypothetical protein